MPTDSELEQEKLKEEIKLLKAKRKQVEHEHSRSVLVAKENDAGNYRNRVYDFTSSVSGSSVNNCIQTLSQWSRIDPGCDITVTFTSPGGYVIDGLGLYDFLRELSSRGHRVTTKAVGYAASMAGVLMQAGDHRVISSRSWFHLHEVQSTNMGSTTEREEQEKFTKRLEDAILDIFDARSKLTKAQIKTRWKKNNVWLSAEQAHEFGFVDEVISEVRPAVEAQ